MHKLFTVHYYYYFFYFEVCELNLNTDRFRSRIVQRRVLTNRYELENPDEKRKQVRLGFHPHLAPRLVLAPQLLVHSVSEARGGDPPRLSDHYVTLPCFLPLFSQHRLQNELGDLRAFPAARLSGDDHHTVAL